LPPNSRLKRRKRGKERMLRNKQRQPKRMLQTKLKLTDLLPKRKPLMRRPRGSQLKRQPDLQLRRQRKPRSLNLLRNQSRRRLSLLPSLIQRLLLTSRNYKMSLRKQRKTPKGQMTSSLSRRLPSKRQLPKTRS